MAKGKGKPDISIELCKGCRLCVEVCPQKALEMSAKVNNRGLKYAVLTGPDKCNGCGLCVIMCPDCAIEIVGEEERKETKTSSRNPR